MKGKERRQREGREEEGKGNRKTGRRKGRELCAVVIFSQEEPCIGCLIVHSIFHPLQLERSRCGRPSCRQWRLQSSCVELASEVSVAPTTPLLDMQMNSLTAPPTQTRSTNSPLKRHITTPSIRNFASASTDSTD